MCKGRFQNTQEIPMNEVLVLLKKYSLTCHVTVTVSINSFTVRITVLNISIFSVLFHTVSSA